MIKMSKEVPYWLAVFIWMEFIFLLSSIPGGMLPHMPSDLWQFWAHRLAHFWEYSVLGVLFLRAYTCKQGRMGVKLILFLSMYIFLSGSLDEWHQTFVPGRNGQLIDAIFDTICGTWGMFLYFQWTQKRFYRLGVLFKGLKPFKHG